MKIIKLTESDLTKLVNRVLKEQGYFDDVKLMPTAYQYNQERERENASPKENINPKNLKVGSGGNSNPSQVADVNRLQTKLIALGLLKTKSGKPTGYFGDATKKALDTYNQSSGPQTESFPLKNKEEGNAFRAWANDNYPRLSKTFELDRSGSYNNENIKNAWNANVQGKTLGQLYLTAKVKGQVSGATAGAEAGKKPSTTDLKDLKVSNQVKSQLNYMKSNNLLKGEKFTILDEKNSQVHAFSPGYKLVRTYYVITGKNKGDQLKTQTMTDWAMKNWTDVGAKFFSSIFNQTKNLATGNAKNPLQDVADYMKSTYFNQKEWYLKNTPSGVFKRAGNITNFMNDLLATTFVEDTYGARFITWETCNGDTIPFGFHGTKSEERLKNLPGNKNFSKEKSSIRKMSFGCVNFGDADVREISSFITAGQLSIWLPDESDNIVEIPSTCVSG
jgi:hypothetical protein